MSIYLFLCIYASVGIISFFIFEHFEPSNTRGDYISSMAIFLWFAPIAIIAAIFYLSEKNEWLNEKL